MNTQCKQFSFDFHPLGRRQVTARFDAPAITSDGGGLLLRELDGKFGLIRQFANCFDDFRSPSLIKHSLQELLAQRIFGIALGYEDLNDHDQLRHDPLLAVLAGKRQPAPQEGFALAGKSTLNRLELTPVGADEGSRYKKIVAHHSKIEGMARDRRRYGEGQAGRYGEGQAGRMARRVWRGRYGEGQAEDGEEGMAREGYGEVWRGTGGGWRGADGEGMARRDGEGQATIDFVLMIRGLASGLPISVRYRVVYERAAELPGLPEWPRFASFSRRR